jgi:outer membrane protein TolC
MLKVSIAKKYPNINFSLSAIRLKDTPTAIFDIPPLPPIKSVVGTKSNFAGDLSFVYPIFSGFAITNSIKKSKLQVLKSKLETDSLERELYLKSLELYGNIYALNKAIKAEKNALKAIEISLKTAKGFYKNELLNLAGVYNIKAKKYDMKASIVKLQNQRDAFKNQLYYIVGTKISNDLILDKDNNTVNFNKIEQIALKNRKDIKAIKEQLKITDMDVKLTKSSYYPTVVLLGGIKKQGDNLRLNGNNHTNPDSSYIGLNFKWNVFDGFAKNHRKEAALKQKEATELYFDDYKNLVKTNIKNSFLTLKSLKSELLWANEQFKSQKEYYKLTKGRFENSLSSADELSRSISKLAAAKAKIEEVKAKIFIQKYKIALEAGLGYFKKRIN